MKLSSSLLRSEGRFSPCCGEEGKSECSTVVGDCGLDETGSVRVGVIGHLGGFGLQYLDESFDLGICEGVGDF